MTASKKLRDKQFWGIQVPGWILAVYLVFAQGITAFSYELGVSMGTQESATTITEVGAAFWYGFAFGDLVLYIPVLILGLVGHWHSKPWGYAALAAALGITVYWPIVCLAALVAARDAPGWNITSEGPYWVACTIIATWGAWGLLVTISQIKRNKI